MKRPDVPLALLQIRDLPLVMHQSHSESLAVHAAQRISCYKLPHKLHQVHSAQQGQGSEGREGSGFLGSDLVCNIIYIPPLSALLTA